MDKQSSRDRFVLNIFFLYSKAKFTETHFRLNRKLSRNSLILGVGQLFWLYSFMAFIGGAIFFISLIVILRQMIFAPKKELEERVAKLETELQSLKNKK